MVGALWGPVGPAEAGVSAGSSAKFKSGGAKGVTLGHKLGRGPATAGLNILEGPVAQRLSTCSPSTYGTSFTTHLGNGWSSLAARSAPCTSASYWGGWGMYTNFKVTAYTPGGTFICRGGTYGYGSSYWYRTSKGWVWSGGTSDPIWNRSC